MLELITTLFGGGATGLLGTVLSGGLAIVTKKNDMKHQIEMRKLDLEELKLEGINAEKQQAMQLELHEMQGQYRALEESYKDARTFMTQGMRLTSAQQWMIVFSDFVRNLMRPGITIFFLYLSYLVWKAATGQIITHVEHTILYLTTTCVLWWFGSRQATKPIGTGVK